MSQTTYTFEYEIKASPKVLYPYLSSPSGLQQWFAEKVTIKNGDIFNFFWDDENHLATLTHSKQNKFVKTPFYKLVKASDVDLHLSAPTHHV